MNEALVSWSGLLLLQKADRKPISTVNKISKQGITTLYVISMLPAISGRLFCAYEPRIALVFSLMHCDMMSKAPRVVLKCGAMLRIILKHSATLEKYPKCFCQSRADAPVTYCWLPAVGFTKKLYKPVAWMLCNWYHKATKSNDSVTFT